VQVYDDPTALKRAGYKSFHEFLQSDQWNSAMRQYVADGRIRKAYQPSTIKNLCQGIKVYKLVEARMPGMHIALSVAKNLHALLKISEDAVIDAYKELLDAVDNKPGLVTNRASTDLKNEKLLVAGLIKQLPNSTGAGGVRDPPGLPDSVGATIDRMLKYGIINTNMGAAGKCNLMVSTLYACGVAPGHIPKIIRKMLGVNIPDEYSAALGKSLEDLKVVEEQWNREALKDYDDIDEEHIGDFLALPGFSPFKRKRDSDQEADEEDYDRGNSRKRLRFSSAVDQVLDVLRQQPEAERNLPLFKEFQDKLATVTSVEDYKQLLKNKEIFSKKQLRKIAYWLGVKPRNKNRKTIVHALEEAWQN